MSCRMLITGLMEALQGEQEAMEYYTLLAGMAPSDEERAFILGIRRDENAHALTLAKWLTKLTGHMHMVMEMPVQPIPNFRTGVQAAIQDETHAYSNYGELANQAMCVNIDLYYDLKNIQKDEKYHRDLLALM